MKLTPKLVSIVHVNAMKKPIILHVDQILKLKHYKEIFLNKKILKTENLWGSLCGHIFNLQIMDYSFQGNICPPLHSVHSTVLEAVQFVEAGASLEEVKPLEECCEVCSSILLHALSLLPALLWLRNKEPSHLLLWPWSHLLIPLFWWAVSSPTVS